MKMVLAAAYAGCRFGELTGLRQKNLDLDEGTLVISEQVVELRGGRLLVRQPKSDAGRRVVHLPAGLVAELRTHLAGFVRPDPEGLVFTSDRGTPLRQSTGRRRGTAVRRPQRRRGGGLPAGDPQLNTVAARAPTVVVDTNVFSADLIRSTRPLVELY